MQLFDFTSRTARLFTTSTAISLILGSAAMAADANAVAERIKALYAQQGGELRFADVQADGSDIILEGTKIRLPSLSNKETMVGDITLENVQDTDEGGYRIEKVSVPDLDFPASETGENDQASFKGIEMGNVIIPPETATSALDKFVLYDRMKIDEITFGTPGTEGGTLRDMEVTLDTSNKTEKMDYAWSIANIDATFPKDKNPLASLNMSSFNGSLNSKGTWRPQSGDMVLDQLEINAVDLGKINITGTIGGYDLAFLEAVQKTQQEMNKADADKEAAGLAALNLAQQLNLQNLTIHFDDDTLTQKLLEYYAKQQGSDAQTLGMQMKMLVPLMATQLKSPEFAQQLAAAADKYFSDPKSLTISASPDQPVTFASIVATASVDPTKLIQLLKLSVDANN
ncbi:hypothetical protein KUG47_04545 [Falsochrobactrum sp. TDYN1]|uniref:DUF945 domain-containing protein n=1 Tax=Falsochrobactrum tianjinense TaxID=2706015 RepID=A0A949UU62_9HYPH|nr:hypothetical protein [Falsochrobactrum sp. TDYN1]MBV2142768.1 hypothetical protein [Falsochrobactrum sp. TDYN1]